MCSLKFCTDSCIRVGVQDLISSWSKGKDISFSTQRVYKHR